MQSYKQLIKEDLYRYTGGKKLPFTNMVRLYGYQYMKTWRKANFFSNKNRFLSLFYDLLLYFKSLKYGFQISPHAEIGHGLYIGHFGSIIVGNEVKIGDNVNLSPNIVIGRENRGHRTGSPIIGSRVWIGSGSVISGKISIGNDVMIAPNSFVNFDVPSNSIVVGNPAVIHSRTNATLKYIDNIVT